MKEEILSYVNQDVRKQSSSVPDTVLGAEGTTMEDFGVPALLPVDSHARRQMTN